MSKFGADFDKIWPVRDAARPRLTDFGRALLMKCKTIEKLEMIVVMREFIERSLDFPIKFPIDTCRIMRQPEARHPIIQAQIASAYPVIHERVLYLYLAFLEHKTLFGNKRELEVFPKLSLTDFVSRLLNQRCATFYSPNDMYLLVTGEDGSKDFVKVGTDAERLPLVLHNVLSYDEIKLSALLSVSSYTDFINDGNRMNRGVVEKDRSKIETEGIVMGIIGARLIRPDVMEYQDVIISKTQNTKENGYGEVGDSTANVRTKDYRRMWKHFYQEQDYLYEDVTKDGIRFGQSKNEDDIFDNVMMKKRYAITFDTLLLESQSRALAAKKKAFIHVVGIGLGVWKVAPQQEQVFLETFAERLKELLPILPNVAVVHFSWFHMTECGELKNGGILPCDAHPDGGIRTFFSKRNPADKLPQPENENMLLIVSYAWDGNALPGNEFWMKMLKSTGDSSTACSTLISELHNPHINTTWVNGDNLHVATESYGVIHIGEYAKKVLDD